MSEQIFNIEKQQMQNRDSMTFEEILKNVNPREYSDREIDLMVQNYDKLKRGNSDIKEMILTKLFRNHFPGHRKDHNPKFHDGYIHFPHWQTREVDGLTISDYLHEARPEIFLVPEQHEKELKIVREILPLEYKIHLMPKPEFTLFIVDQLLKAIKDDEELHGVIYTMKVKNDEKKPYDYEDIKPSIVIYTTLGKDNAQKALDKIYQYLGQYAHMGTGIVPRYNRKINELIFYAQGDGGYKRDYKRLMEKYKIDWKNKGVFEEDLVHFKGDFHLKSPASAVK